MNPVAMTIINPRKEYRPRTSDLLYAKDLAGLGVVHDIIAQFTELLFCLHCRCMLYMQSKYRLLKAVCRHYRSRSDCTELAV